MEKYYKLIFPFALLILLSLLFGCMSVPQKETPSALPTTPAATPQSTDSIITAAPSTPAQTETPGVTVQTETPAAPAQTDTPAVTPTETPAAPTQTETPGTPVQTETPDLFPLSNKPAVLDLPMPSAPGADVLSNEKAEIDVSNKQDGYVMIRYLEQVSNRLKVIITGPSGTNYQYNLRADRKYEVFPLSDGSGTYKIAVYEGAGGDRYSTAYSGSLSVKLTDEFAPFLRPNQYVNYTADSEAIKKAQSLTKSAVTTLDVITVIYEYVVENLSYDNELAKSVQSGYLPDIDAALKKGKGICFDYAAIMTAMLRSQGIPTKLVVGYTGEQKHAWISTYSEETGWMNNIIYFDGNKWKLMDPTYASSGNQSSEIMKYIGNEKNYSVRNLY